MVGNQGTVLVGAFDILNHETRVVVAEVKIDTAADQAFLLEFRFPF